MSPILVRQPPDLDAIGGPTWLLLPLRGPI